MVRVHPDPHKNMAEKEKISNTGKIIIVTGRTGCGKDFLVDELEKMSLIELGLSRVVTHATRQPRVGEINHTHYHFCSDLDLDAMHSNNELVETPVITGSSRKATSKKELLQVLEGKHKIWRIDLSLAAKIASGEYYHNQFDSQTAAILASSTVVIYIDVEQEILNSRRQSRDKEKYDPKEYAERDAQELDIINLHGHHFSTRILNPDGKIDETKQNLYNLVSEFINN